jgi:hypothetical protein
MTGLNPHEIYRARKLAAQSPTEGSPTGYRAEVSKQLAACTSQPKPAASAMTFAGRAPGKATMPAAGAYPAPTQGQTHTQADTRARPWLKFTADGKPYLRMVAEPSVTT